MASTSFGGDVFTFNVNYTYSDGVFKITGVKSTASSGGYASWDLTPGFYFYIVEGTSSVPSSYQTTGPSTHNIENWVKDHNGVYMLYEGDSPSSLLSNTRGGTVTWASSKYSSLKLTTSAANVTLGTIIRNTSGTLNGHAYGSSTLSLYVPPSNITITSSEVTSTSFKISASWTGGNNADGRAYITANGQTKLIDNDPVTFSGLTPNTVYSVVGKLSEKNHTSTTYDTHTISVLTNIVAPSSWTTATSTTNAITVAATSSNGGKFKYQFRIQKNGTWSGWQDSGSFTGLSANTNYPLEARCVNTDNTSIVSSSLSGSLWTHPVVNTPVLSLPSGKEHNTINVSVSASVASSHDQFAYKIDSGSWSGYTSNTHSFTGLGGNTTHTIHVKMKNTSSGYESAEKSASITTWHNPLTNLQINLTNRWFWYLSVNCSYTYTGTITKYEFAIGSDQTLQNKGTTNSHSRGTTDPANTSKLNYNTSYDCQVKVTDNHGRTYGVSGTTHTFTNAKKSFKTLDERPLYVNGTLREVKLIKPDGSVSYITPNLLSIVQENGTVVNMNKIINNDNRTQYQ